MFDRDRNQPDRYQGPKPAGQPVGGAPTQGGITGGVVINGQRVGINQREGLLTMSFVWMFAALLLSAFAAYFVYSNPSIQTFVVKWYFALIIGELGLVLAISFGINKIGALPALALLFVYALLTGLTIGALVQAYVGKGDPTAMAAVASSFVGASAVFGGAALYGFATKRDLTGIGGILFMGLIGLIAMSFVQVFFFSGNSTFNLVIGAVGVLIFTGLTAYHVQALKNGKLSRVQNAQSASVVGALVLYLDFINLFLMMLRIFGGGGRS